MIKPWSISTTVRNPERIRDFLKVLKLLEGKIWSRDTQRKFQITLIQYKVYGYGSQQFYTGLSEEHLKLMSNPEIISFSKAEEILKVKGYVGGGDMRGRQSFNPLEKMGLVFLDKKNRIKISTFGNCFLREDFDLGVIFFKSFLKWQLPNPDSRDFRKADGFNIKPFIATLHLIYKVNKKWVKLGNKPIGISKKEFALFVPTLINYKKIDKTAKEIVNLRTTMDKIKKNKKGFFEQYRKKFMANFLDTQNSEKINSNLKNTLEYADNILRYFRLTRYIYVRGNGYYIDLESRRTIELNCLLEQDHGAAKTFKNKEEYINYISDINQPVLLWETENKLKEIIQEIIKEIKLLEKKLSISEFKKELFESYDINKLKLYIGKLRGIRRELQEKIDFKHSQKLTNVLEYIKILKKEIYGMDNRPIILEKYITLGLNALDDALKINPNYPVGDDNEPTHTAPGGKPDIECFYKKYNSICEVTMLRDRSQWFNEGQPVMRHLKDFEEENTEKESYCLFIAPGLHVDTIETFWISVNHGYRGKKQKIIPLSLEQFVEILEIFVKIKQLGKNFSHEDLFRLYDDILDLRDISNSDEWIKKIPIKIENWNKGLTS